MKDDKYYKFSCVATTVILNNMYATHEHAISVWFDFHNRTCTCAATTLSHPRSTLHHAWLLTSEPIRKTWTDEPIQNLGLQQLETADFLYGIYSSYSDHFLQQKMYTNLYGSIWYIAHVTFGLAHKKINILYISVVLSVPSTRLS